MCLCIGINSLGLPLHATVLIVFLWMFDMFFSCFVVWFHDDGDGDDDGASASLTQWSAVKNHEQ